MVHDLRDGARALWKQPRFTLVASLTLALGVGAVTAIFSVVNGVLLRPLPLPDADRVVNVWSNAPGLGYDQFPLSPDLYFFYARENAVFDRMAMFRRDRVNLTETGEPEVVESAVTTASYFPTLGVTPAIGRGYRDDEDRPGASRVVVVSHRFWRQRFDGDPGLLGRLIRLDGQPTEVIGITPAWFDTAGSPDLFLPARLDPDNPPQGTFGWYGVARLEDGVSAETAAAGLVPLVERFKQEVATSPNYRAFLADGQYRPLVHVMKEDVIGDVREPLWILLGTVGFVLLIACANVANLFLVRAEGRQREIAVRVALGAGRSGLVRKILTEAMLLSALGSGLGLLVSATALPALLSAAPTELPRLDQVRLDTTVVLFAVATASLSALAFGLVPALRYTRPGSVGALRHGGRGGTDEPARRRARNLLVVAQTALALILLVGSGLLARSFSNLLTAELGFRPDHVLTFRLALSDADYPESADIVGFQQRILERLRAIPGVQTAGGATVLPIDTGAPGTTHEFEGQPTPEGQLPPMVHYTTVTPGFFEAMSIPILHGRDYHSGDTRDGVMHAVVNAALADKYWLGQDPIGKRFRLGSSSGPEAPPWFTVVGVVGSVRQDGLREPTKPLVYYGLNETAPNGTPRVITYTLRGEGLALRADAVRQAVWSVDPNMPIAAIEPMTRIVDRSIVQFTFTMLTLGIAAAMALVLGAIGLYGVLSYAVTQRTREIGVRLALGASPSHVMRSVVLQGAAVTGVGLVIGIAGAIGLTRFLGQILYETEPLDPWTFAAMTALLFAVSLLASFIPARRAAAVSPLESMKYE
jgi:predicted permease